MKRLFHVICTCFCLISHAEGQNVISACKCWLDANYGSAQTFPGNGDSREFFLESIDCSSLEEGFHFFNFRCIDDSGRWSSVLSQGFYKLDNYSPVPEKTIVRYKYWIDAGQYVENTFLSPAGSLLFTDLFTLDTLKEGIHSFQFSTQDNSGLWSPVATKLFFKMAKEQIALSEQIIKTQFWIDQGSVQNKAVSSPGQIFNLSDSYALDTLTEGVHSFNVRFLSDNHQWSSIYSRHFYKMGSDLQTGNSTLNYAEYWIDSSPDRHSQSLEETVNFVMVENLDLDSLAQGVHSFNIRFREKTSHWSSVHTFLFYKMESSETGGNAKLSSAGFWIDNGPVIQLTTFLPSGIIKLSEILNLDSLSQGVHSLNIRFRNDSALWSSVKTHLFYKISSEISPLESGINSISYWLDNHSDEITTQSISSGQTFSFLTELNLAGLENGIHALNFRFTDDQGRISSLNSRLFYKVTQEEYSDHNFINAYRIIYDNDPGLMQIIDIANNTDNPLFINTSIPSPIMEVGDHVVALQFRDQKGMWSSVFCDTIMTDSIPQKIELLSGWNLVSLNIYPTNRDMMVIVQPLIDNNQLVKVQDESGLALLRIPGETVWNNDIGEWFETEGYRIHVNKNSMFTTYGDLIGLPVKIYLKAGWNIISYPSRTNQVAMNIIDSLRAHKNLFKFQNEKGKAIEIIPGSDILIDNIGNLMPGEGYMLRVQTDDSITIYEHGLAKPLSVLKSLKLDNPLFFWKIWSGNGYKHMNLYLKNKTKDGYLLLPGDEVAVFDEGRCVGVSVVEDLDSEYISIIASSDDPMTNEIDGFIEENPIHLRVWKNGNVIILDSINFIPASNTIFQEGGSAAIEFDPDILSTSLKTDEITALMAYPNPFSKEINIIFQLKREAKLRIEVCNLLGQLIYSQSQFFGLGAHKISWNGKNTNGELASPGIYNLKLTSLTGEFQKSFTIVKIR